MGVARRGLGVLAPRTPNLENWKNMQAWNRKIRLILELRPRNISDAWGYVSCTGCHSTIESNSSCAYMLCTVHIPAGVQSIWLMFLSQLQSTISDQACVPHLPTTIFYLVFNQDWASGHFPMPGHLRGTVCQLKFRTYPTPQLSRILMIFLRINLPKFVQFKQY